MDDWSFVGGDGVGSVLQRGADVVDGGLAVFHVERCGFEEDVGAGRGEPVVDVCWLLIRLPTASGRGRPLYIQAIRIGDPSQAAAGDSGDAERDSVAVAEFFFAIEQELDERAVDVAKAEEAKVVGMNWQSLRG